MKPQIQRLVTIILITLFIQPLFSQTREKVNLMSNGNALNAYFYHGTSGAPIVILLHGLPGNDVSPLNLAENLNSKGYNILVFNYQGTYASEGYFGFLNSINDLDAAIGWLKQQDHISKYSLDTSRIVVCGYSFGGSLVMIEAIKNKSIKNIVNIAGGDQSVALTRLDSDSLYRKKFETAVSGYYVPSGPLKADPQLSFHQQVSDLIARRDEFDLGKYADRLANRNILFIVSWMDLVSKLEENTLPIYRKLVNLGGHVSIKAFEGEHQFSKCRSDLAQTIADWIQSNIKGT
jgi:pimeloyl-ACP methyl ester carboxylesterase